MAVCASNYFDLFVTCVDKVGPMLKIWGQTDRLSSMFVEQLLKTTYDQFETEQTVIQLSKLNIGLLCCAKYKDGIYYRAQITNLRHLVTGSVEVKFIDYGNVELITIENIRLLENVPIGLSTMKPQAVDFILANVIDVNQHWDEKALAFIHQEIAYMELKSTIVGAVNNFRFLKVIFHETDLSDYLVQKGIAMHIPLASQENIIRGTKITQIIAPQFQNMHAQVPNALPMQRPNVFHQQMQQQSQLSPMATPELCSYKTLPLEPNSEHLVYISYVEDGPYLFSIQLQSMEDALTKLMIEINQLQNLLQLSESPVPGYPCMARCLEDDSLCRAVVINLVEGKCKTYFVDFGNTDILPFSNIFQIPFKYMLPKVMSMRFTLAGLKNINVTNEMKCAFKEYVTNKLLKLKVLKLEGSPVLQYCELFDAENKNIINILYESSNQYKTLQIVKGMKYNVIVSFIEGCKKFYVQLKECSDSLNNLMLALATTCENSSTLQELKVESPCVAFYSGDNQWYRAQIISVTDNTVTVKYVDYGNEDTVAHNCLKTIDPNFVKILPAQAIECCLYGYQNMSFNTEIENVFESLTLECEFTMKVISKQSNDTTMLVDLFDASGNNVAALLIEKLASQKSQISPLPASSLTRSLLNNEENENPNAERKIADPRSPRSEQDKLSWRNSSNDKAWRSPPNENKKPLRNANDDKRSWRNTEDSPPNNRPQNQNNSWNGDSPTNKRSQRPERSFSRNSNSQPREGGKFRSDNKRSPQNDSGRGNSNWNSGSESEKSWSGNSAGKGGGSKKDFKQPKRNEFPRKQNDFAKRKPELPPQDLSPLEDPFKMQEITPGSTETVSISWFYDPENFFCQLVATQKEFRDMMADIQSAYNARPSLTGEIPLGASVIAEFHDDAILYRATVIENKYPKYKVQYVDFGNMSLVDCRKIWQVEKRFKELPIQAIKCGISGLKPTSGSWTVNDEIDRIFNKDSFSATFEGCNEMQYFVQLFDNDAYVKIQLIASGLAVDGASAIQMADDPIDVNVLLSQNLNVKISSIQGLNKFFVHLEEEKANYVHTSIQSFMENTNKSTLLQFSEDQIIIGTTCLVHVNDEIWYRGVITNNSDLSALNIDYPDFGGSQVYSSEKLYVLPDQLCAFWYQAFECSHHNLSDEVKRLVTDEEFKQNYEGKNLILYVDEIVDLRLIVTLYDASGTKLDLIEPDVDAFPTVDQICPMPVLNASFLVWVTHVNNVGSVYLQRNSDETKIANLLQSLFDHYDSNEESSTFSPDDLCCAKSEDGNWYRGRIEEINDETAAVLYIDYGNSETLPVDKLRTLDLTVFNMHELALNVSLNLKEISTELTSKLEELTTQKLLTANIIYGESGWLVVLSDCETNINQTLIDLKLAAPIDEPSTPLVEETIAEEVEAEEPKQIVSEESRAQVTITHIDSPSEFYVQLVANEDSIFALQADLQEKVSDLPDLEGADIGVLCAAKYTVDEQWYRAEVLDADAEITTVRFVDYGNTDVITNNQGSIKTLPAELLAVDKYARKCSLNVINKGEEWTQEAAEMFENSVNADLIHADIVYQDERNKTFVELYVNGINIAQQLIDSNLADTITRDHEDNIANNTGFVSHLNTVSEFWIQLESSVPDLEMIVDRLASADTFPDLQDLSPGILCAANFPDDEMWYRARILSNTVAGIEVLFVDYGNSSTALKLKVLPEDLIHMPILAQKCSLNKPANISTWSDQAIEKFREISEDGITIFTIKKLSAGETSTVELFIDEQNILEQLVDLCEERMAPVGEPNYTKAIITHVESPSYFWIQLSSDKEKINEMTEILASANEFKELVDFDLDTTCAALFSDNSLWYRAKILEKIDGNYEVLLVDYGNTICTKDVRVLSPELESIQPMATLCTLKFPKDVTEWTDTSNTNFSNLMTETSADFQVEFLDNEVPSQVRIFLNGKSIAEDLFVEAPQEILASASSVSLTSEEVNLLAVNTQLPEPIVNADLDIEEIEECDTTLKDDLVENTLTTTEFCSNTSGFLDSELINTNDNQDIEDTSTNESLITASALVNENLTIEEIVDNEVCTGKKIVGNETLTNNGALVCETLETIDNLTITEAVNNNDSNNKTSENEDNLETEDCNKDTLNENDKNITDNVILIDDKNKNIQIENVISHETSINDDENDKSSKFEILINEEDVNKEISAINESVNSEMLPPPRPNKPNTPHSEKIIPGAISGSDTKIPQEEEEPSEETIKEDPTPVCSRPTTPFSERIVPGSICRGDLEEPSEDLYSELKHAEEVKDEIQTIIRSRPVTPRSEKIVSGAICRGDLEKLSYEDVVPIPSTPLCDKIVPGSICRGDLEDPTELTCESIPETVISDLKQSEVTIRPATPKTPKEDKIVPGCITRGMDLEPEPDNTTT